MTDSEYVRAFYHGLSVPWRTALELLRPYQRQVLEELHRLQQAEAEELAHGAVRLRADKS